MIEEIWKDIPGYYGYQASNLGNIKCFVKDKERILKSNLQSKGYIMVSVKPKANLVHRLVAFSFIPNPENKPCINHKDGNKLNNNVENLEWCTYKENMLHAMGAGLRNNLFSGNCKSTKLKYLDVLEIRKSKLKASLLSEIYGVGITTIRDIWRNKTWKHV